MTKTKQQAALDNIRKAMVDKGEDEAHIDAGINVLASASVKQLNDVLKAIKAR